MLLGDGEKVIFVIKWQRTWLDYVPPLMSCGRWNSQAMKWIIQLQRFLSKVFEGRALGPPYCLQQNERERDKLKKELLSKVPELEDLEDSQPIHIAENDDACTRENTTGVADNHLIRRLMWV